MPNFTQMTMNFTPLDHLLQDAVPTVAPALVCRVERGGKLVYEGAFGWINPMLKRQPVTGKTLFDFASLTKLFTTTACLRMADAGLLGLDQPIADFIPAFDGERMIGPFEDPISKEMMPPLPAWQAYRTSIDAGEITFRHLLTHTSGLPAWRNLYARCGAPPERPHAMHRGELLRRQRTAIGAITEFDLAYPPGQSYVYSDLGLILLGAAIAACAGDPTVADTIRNWVTEPLGLEAHFNPTCVVVDRIAPTEFCAWRQRRLHGEVHDENAAGMGGIAGHAGLFGTATDLCRLGRLYIRHGERLLSKSMVDAAISQQIEATAPGVPLAHAMPVMGGVAVLSPGIRLGLGWMLRSEPDPSCSMAFGPNSFGHTGYTGTSLWCDPDRDLVVALLTNRVYNGRNPDPIEQLRPAVYEAVVDALF